MMNIQKYYTIAIPHSFAASYDCSAYGAGAYNEGQVCGTSTVGGSSGGTSGGGNDLVNTGVHVVLPILVGVALIVTAIVLFVRKPKKTTK
jgi:hypothetical protein